jgi:hypothetical protein
MFQKWAFYSKLFKLKGASGETKDELAQRMERYLIDRDKKLLNYDSVIEERQ